MLLLLILALLAFGILVAVAPLTEIAYWGIDIYTFRAAAKAMAFGENPYSEPNILRFADGAQVGNIHNFVYAPFFGFMLRPLAWVSPESASRVWFVFNIAFYFGSITLLMKAIKWQPGPDKFLLAILGLILFPSLRTALVIGQSNLFMLFWFSLSYYLLKRSRPVWSGASLSLALFKPHLAPLLLYYLFKQQGRLLAGFVLGSVVLSLPFVEYLPNWIDSGASAYALNSDRGGCLRMVSLTAMYQCFLPTGWIQNTAIALSLLLVLGIVLPYFWKDSDSRDPAFDFHTALAISLIILLLDNVRIADQTLLVFPLLVVWRDWMSLESWWAKRLSIAVLMMIYVIPYSVDLLQAQNIAFILPMWYVGVTVAVLALLLLQTSELQRQQIVER